MNILAVAEKPSVAKELAAILSNNYASSRHGRSPYNRIYDCNNVEFRGHHPTSPSYLHFFSCYLISVPSFPRYSYLLVMLFSVGQRSRMSITSVSGHLCEEDFGPDYKW